MALISKLYQRGDESAAHYVRHKGDRSSNWAHVPKNKRKGKVIRVNIWTADQESKHGCGSAFAYMDGSAMSDDDMLKLLGTSVSSDPLLLLLGK